MGALRWLLPVSVLIAAVLLPGTASAATCSDYPDQAAAQRAGDTIDGDGDGIYCEALPCPCSTASAGVGGGSFAPSRGPAGGSTRPAKHAQHIRAQITSVVDGDTIKVKAQGAARQWYTVRLIGIDTPETHRPGVPVQCGGRRASSNMLRLAFTTPVDTNGDGLYDQEGGQGRRVTLMTDPTQDTFDRYGRLLAYVTTVAGVSLQARQLADGWAKTYVYEHHPFEQVSRFRAAQQRAASRDRGVYGRCDGNFHRSL